MIWLLITSGRGPGECEIAVAKATKEIIIEATSYEVESEVLEAEAGRHGYASALIALRGEGADVLSQTWVGTVLWICPSPIRPGWGRKNWFIGVSRLSAQLPPTLGISEKDLRWETMKASGPGGQHVNTTESAVRLKHLPSGVTVSSREERSQHRNRSLALARLVRILEERNRSKAGAMERERWRKHDSVERGNPIRTYNGLVFRRV